MPTDKIIDRVRKLLELSHSTNEHEAAQAAARAAKLMSEHDVTQAMLNVTAEEDRQPEGRRQGARSRQVTRLEKMQQTAAVISLFNTASWLKVGITIHETSQPCALAALRIWCKMRKISISSRILAGDCRRTWCHKAEVDGLKIVVFTPCKASK